MGSQRGRTSTNVAGRLTGLANQLTVTFASSADEHGSDHGLKQPRGWTLGMSTVSLGSSARDDRVSFSGVIKDPRSYRNIVYLLLGLPLGTLYFALLVTGVSVGVSMMVLALVGVPILIGLWYAIRALMEFERSLAVGLLGEDIAALPATPTWTGGLWQQFKALMSDRPTHAGAWFLLLRFPVGIATFTIAVTLIAVSLGMTFAPTWMWTSDELTWAGRTFDPFPWSFALVPVGIVLVFSSLHTMNWLARACGRWARSSLGGHEGGAIGHATDHEIDLGGDKHDIQPQRTAEKVSVSS